MSNRWNQHFLKLCLEIASMSKDPNTKVGAVIVGPDREIRSTGFNGFPRRIIDTPERLADREIKNAIMVHAECNAIFNAARIGVQVKACKMYLAATDDTGEIWSGPPCSTHCTPALIQAGITEVIGWPFKDSESKWRKNIDEARKLLAEAGVFYREVSRW